MLEGSLVRSAAQDELFFSDPATRSPVRTNLSLFSSQDSGASWRLRRVVDEGAAAYSALQVLPGQGRLALLYERAEQRSLVFEPDEIVFLEIQM